MKNVVIVGGGASGLLVAANLLRNSNRSLAIKIVEPNSEIGSGVAYGTNDPDHLLNVPASRMSAFADQPNSLSDWLNVSGDSFVSRMDYRRYLQSILDQAIFDSKGKHSYEHLFRTVVTIQQNESVWGCVLDDGNAIQADAVVLATGHQKIITPEALLPLTQHNGIVVDVWRQPFSSEPNRVAIIGTGLTFYDVTISYLRENPSAQIYGISRNGLLPSPHLRHREPPLPVPNVVKSSAQAIRDYLIASGEKWREAQDGIRHDLQEIWSNFPDSEKRNFLDKYFRWWNVLRHRSAPDAHERIQNYLSQNRVEIVKANIDSITPQSNEFVIKLDSGQLLEVDQIINCCGNSFEISNPLLINLIELGICKSGPLNLGIAIDPKNLRVINSAGVVNFGMYAIGPILVGELLETTAIPEIKLQAASIAEMIVESFSN